MNTGSGRQASVRGEPGVISLAGRISFDVLPGLMDAYARAGVDGTVRLDFSGVRSLDVPGLNALVKLHLHARGQGRQLRATGLDVPFRDVLRASCIDEAVPFDPVPETASGYPRGGPGQGR
jgi:ABC-type transporter Mla MlaB component